MRGQGDRLIVLIGRHDHRHRTTGEGEITHEVDPFRAVGRQRGDHPDAIIEEVGPGCRRTRGLPPGHGMAADDADGIPAAREGLRQGGLLDGGDIGNGRPREGTGAGHDRTRSCGRHRDHHERGHLARVCPPRLPRSPLHGEVARGLVLVIDHDTDTGSA